MGSGKWLNLSEFLSVFFYGWRIFVNPNVLNFLLVPKKKDSSLK